MALFLVLLGPPASGKGTQGKRLAEREELPYLSTGSLLRQVVAKGGALGREIEPVLARGGYVDDQLMCRIMDDWLADHRHGWVLDGFPRTLAQDDFLHHWIEARGGRIDAAIALRVPKEKLIERMENRVECPACGWSGQTAQLGEGQRCPACGRPAGRRDDDTLENFLTRYREFERRTIPVIERYAATRLLIECDASRDIDEVAADIAKSVNPIRSHGQKA